MPKKEKEKRHKCSHCGRVRSQKYLSQLTFTNSTGITTFLKTKFGFFIWCCVDSTPCKIGMKRFFKS